MQALAILPPAQLKAVRVDLEKLKDKLREELLREMQVVDTMKVIVSCHTSVFSEATMAAPFPKNFKMPSIMLYDEKGDQVAYVEVFHSWMDFKKILEVVRCFL